MSKKQKPILKFDSKTVSSFVRSILESNEWENGNQIIYGGGYFFLDNINIKNFPSKKTIKLNFTIEYKTQNHKAINNVVWEYTYKNIMRLQNDITSLHHDIVSKTGDKDCVFSERFNKKLFDEKNYQQLGWKIIK